MGCLVRVSFLVHRGLCSHTAEKERELAFWGILYKGTNATYEVFIFMIQSFPQMTTSK